MASVVFLRGARGHDRERPRGPRPLLAGAVPGRVPPRRRAPLPERPRKAAPQAPSPPHRSRRSARSSAIEQLLEGGAGPLRLERAAPAVGVPAAPVVGDLLRA